MVAASPTRYAGSPSAWVSALLVSATIGWFFAPFLRLDAILVERDALSFILPMQAFHARALASGALPWWNPAPVLGKPFLAEWQPGLFYPPSLLLLVRPFALGFNLFYVGHYWLAAIGALLWLRGRGAGTAGAILGALVWALGGPLLSLGYVLTHLTSLAWLPWVLWAWDRGRSTVTRVAASGAMLALPLLAGSPEMVCLIAFLLLLASRDPRSLAALPIAAGLAAIQIVPFLCYLPWTYRGGVGLDSAAALAYSASLAELVQLVHFRGVIDPEPYLRSVYVGLLPLLLALVALSLAPFRLRCVLAVVVAGLVVLALGANTPVGPLLQAHLPLASLIRFPEKFVLALVALVAAGAAFGCARLASLAATEDASGAEGRVGLAIGLCLVAAVVLDLARVNRGLSYAAPPAQVLAAPALARAMLDDVATRAVTLRYYANSTGGPEALSVGAAADLDREILFAAVGELYGLGNLNSPGGLNLIAHERLQRALSTVPRAVAIDAMAALGVRYVTSWRVLDATAGLETIPIPRPTRGASLYRVTAAGPRAFIARRIIAAPDAEGAVGRFVAAPAGSHTGLAVLEMRDAIALPIGARLLRGELVGASEPRRRNVSWPETGPSSSDPAGAIHEPARPADTAEPVRLSEEGSDRLSIAARLDRPGLLVVNDSWFEGWRAEVDGEPTPILRVDGLVRGVWLGSGHHVVRMSYRPRGLVAGFLISLVTLGALLAFVVIGPRSVGAETQTAATGT